ncbi:MAG: mannose-1-phosphate guanylyltransferase [Oscillospiraceae bacterium]|nr:mannose-1-phosphate guanylyltransferase [Oscillospiraceae bacterium]
MNIILLSGGSGKRLWPLSNSVRSKQFLKILDKGDGTKESMAQRMYRMIKKEDPNASIVIATSQDQVPQIKAQLAEDVRISVEPERRDTFPAIALACFFLEKNGIGKNEPVIVCPVDPFVEQDYFEGISCLAKRCGDAKLTLMGVEPTYPSRKFGYIIPETKETVSRVSTFKEKPDEELAQQYIDQGALWNCGVFAFKLGYVLDIARQLLGVDDYDDLYQKYGTIEKISFDYAVVEKEKDINVIRFSGQWKDLGTWNTLAEAMKETVSGNAFSAHSENTHVINELNIPLLVLGVNNAVVAATPDGILVCDKDKADELKSYVNENRPMYERREWGEYKVLEYHLNPDGNNVLVKELIISEGKHISYQRHRRRTEIWTFTDGIGELIIGGVTRNVQRGDTVVIPPLEKHAIKGVTKLHIIEVQMGDELTEDDIERLDWKWD